MTVSPKLGDRYIRSSSLIAVLYVVLFYYRLGHNAGRSYLWGTSIGVTVLGCPWTALLVLFLWSRSGDNSVENKVLMDIRTRSPDAPIFLFRCFKDNLCSAVFYNRNPIPIIDSCSKDLLYSLVNENPGKIFVDNRRLSSCVGSDDALILVMKKDRKRFSETFDNRFTPWKDYGRIIVYFTRGIPDTDRGKKKGPPVGAP